MRLLALLFAIVACAGTALATCPPTSHDRDDLHGLREKGFALDDAVARNALALELLDCLGAPDPALRDGIAFEGLSTWLRAKQLSATTREVLFDRLLLTLDRTNDDEAGFRRPFAALAMSEVARTDRIDPWLSAWQREALVAAATRYLTSVHDYRGFDDREGWRHGVAHGSDLLLQLVLNPALSGPQIEQILAAVATQIAPVEAHFYRFGEPERLARPVLYAALRESRSAEQWQQWFKSIASPSPLPDWRAAFRSQVGLARRHNVRAFLSAIYVAAREDENPTVSALAPMALAGLREIP